MPAVILQRRPQPTRTASLLEGLNQAFGGFQQGQQLADQRQQAGDLNQAKIESLNSETSLNNDRLGGRSVDNITAGLESLGISPDQAGGFANLARASEKINFNDIVNTPQSFGTRNEAADNVREGNFDIAAGLNSIANQDQIQPRFDTIAQGITTNRFGGDTQTSGLTDSIVNENNAQAFESRQGGLLDQQKAQNAQNGVVSPAEALRQQKLQLEVDKLGGEAEKQSRIKQNAVNSAIGKAQNVISNIEQARQLSGGSTTGALGAVLRNIPGFDAFDLSQKVDTIRANLGIDELLRVKEAGGTFGALSDTELNVLQNSIANLNQAQSQPEFDAQLDVVERQYQTLIGTLQQDGGQTPQAQTEKLAQPQTQQPQQGQVVDGYEFLGGDPSRPDSWRAVPVTGGGF